MYQNANRMCTSIPWQGLNAHVQHSCHSLLGVRISEKQSSNRNIAWVLSEKRVKLLNTGNQQKCKRHKCGKARMFKEVQGIIVIGDANCITSAMLLIT